MKRSIGAKTILYPTPVIAVSTYDENRKANVMIVAWGGICCSEPPCIAISLRKATYTYHNLLNNKAFIANIAGEEMVDKLDYMGITSGQNVDKLERLGLTPERCHNVNAPYIKEFPLIIQCNVIRVVEIGLHTQFIGEIIDIMVEEKFLDKEGNPDITKIKPVVFDPARREYFSIGDSLGKAFSIGRKLKIGN